MPTIGTKVEKNPIQIASGRANGTSMITRKIQIVTPAIVPSSSRE